MKKILIVHNKYRNLGGEDIAVIQEIEVLKNYFEVETLYFENKLDNLFLDMFTFLFKNNPNSNKILKNIIEEFKPDIVYVAMGSPKQEKLMERIQKSHDAVYQGLGGSFDVYIGAVKRAPEWWVKNNMEWAYGGF